jgi:hypothetical protein
MVVFRVMKRRICHTYWTLVGTPEGINHTQNHDRNVTRWVLKSSQMWCCADVLRTVQAALSNVQRSMKMYGPHKPWRWRQYITKSHFQRHGVTFHNILILSYAAIRNAHLKKSVNFSCFLPDIKTYDTKYTRTKIFYSENVAATTPITITTPVQHTTHTERPAIHHQRYDKLVTEQLICRSAVGYALHDAAQGLGMLAFTKQVYTIVRVHRMEEILFTNKTSNFSSSSSSSSSYSYHRHRRRWWWWW